MVILGLVALLVVIATFVILRIRIEWEQLNERLELVEDELFAYVDDVPPCDCGDCLEDA